MTEKDSNMPTKSSILLYQTEDGRQRIEVRLENETVWLNQRLLSELFQKDVRTINEHIKNIYDEGELTPEATIRKFRIVQTEGGRQVSRTVDFYNLDVIIAVGYRVHSHRGTQFRQWATERLREFIVKGFTLDDERLSESDGIKYFDELLERIRAIRASEKRFYQKIRDIYTLSADYDKGHNLTKEFFATVQNKILYAVTGMTAAELIHSRADAGKPNMGLTTWKGVGHKRQLTKQDTEIAKNYLYEEEMRTLELLVNQYLDFAELQARQHKIMYMADWKKKLDAFLELNDQDILSNAGRISSEMAVELAHAQYELYSNERNLIEANKADEELREAIKKLTSKEIIEGDENG
ncbi:MAG: virulence RhuM family protein [Candidatus Methanoperedens sp.]